MPDSRQDTLYRVPPHDFTAEMAVLGCILVNNRACEAVADFLEPDHFADARHRAIYAACLDLTGRGQEASPLTLGGHFEATGELADLGGNQYLARLYTAAPAPVLAEGFGRAVRDRALRRRLVEIADDLKERAYATTIDSTAEGEIEEAERALRSLADTKARDASTVGAAAGRAIDEAQELHRNPDAAPGIRTHIGDLDKQLGPMRAGDLVIIGARPYMGKTSLATHIALKAALPDDATKAPETVAFFSHEQTAEQNAITCLTILTGIPGDRIESGRLSGEEWCAVTDAKARLDAAPLLIDDTPGMHVSTMRMRARRLKPGLIVVDYLQLLSGGEKGERYGNPVERVTSISRGLKLMAMDLRVPVIALSQLSRQVEQRDDKRPVMSDLRESGAIEQDADKIMLMYRGEYYLKQVEPPRDDPAHAAWQVQLEKCHNKAEIIIPKARRGRAGKVDIFYDDTRCFFGNIARDPDDAGRMF